MTYREKGKVCMVAFAIVLLSASQAQARGDSSASGGMRITSCLVYSTKSPDKTYDCSAQAAQLCNGKEVCEIQIGYNLTAGKDIEPGSGFLGKSVKLAYVCGEMSKQRGPYPQSDHASLLLECSVIPG